VSEQIVSPRAYYGIFAALIALTLLTVGISFVDLGSWHLIVGLLIGAAKAALVVLFFMHLLASSRLTWLVLGAGIFWLAILLSFTLADYMTRGWLAY